MRRAVTIIGFITTALLIAAPSGLSAQTIQDGVQYTLSGDASHYEVTGFDKASAEAIGWDGALAIADAIGGTPVTVISASAFDASSHPDCNAILEVTFGANIQEVGDFAFFQCNSLKVITMNSGLLTIGANAFKQCTALTSVTLPSNLQTVGSGAFYGCTALVSLTILSSGLNIGTSAFISCTALREIIIPGACPTVGMTAFYGVGTDANPAAVLVDKARVAEFFGAMYGAGRYYGWTGGEGKLSLQMISEGIRYAYVAQDGGTPAFYEIVGLDAATLTNLGSASAPVWLVQSPATTAGLNVLSVADNAFNSSLAADIAVIDLRQSDITGVTISRSAGAFNGVSAKTLVYMRGGNDSGENNVIIGDNVSVALETMNPASTYTAAEVSSGRAAWMLNSQWGIQVFGQQIGTEATPLPMSNEALQRVWQVTIDHGAAVQYRYANTGGSVVLPGNTELDFAATDTYHLYIDQDVSKPFTATSAVSSDLSVTAYPKAESLTLDKTAVTLRMSDPVEQRMVQLTAGLLPDAAMKGVSWSSSAAGVATVDATGLVTAVGGGKADITATALDDGSVKAVCQVTVIALPEKIEITPAEIRLVSVGDKSTLTSTILPAEADQNVVWESADTDIVTVDADGTLTAKALGKTFVYCYSADVYPAMYSFCRVIVGSSVTGISLSNTELKMHPGDEHTLTFSVNPQDAVAKLSWSSSNTAVAEVNGSGVIKALSAGEANITVCSVDDNNVKAVCHVIVGSSLTTVTLSDTELKLLPNVSATLTATLTPSNAVTDLSWSSSDTKVATVTKGEVKAVAAGEADITVVSLEDASVKAVCHVTVIPYPEQVQISMTEVKLEDVGDTYQLSAKVLPAASNQKVIWESGNEDIATIDANGVVTGKSLGITYVNCYPADNYPAMFSFCRIIVGTPPEKDTDNDNSTAIQSVAGDDMECRYYDLQGRYIGTTLDTAPKGIYIKHSDSERLSERKVVKH